MAGKPSAVSPERDAYGQQIMAHWRGHRDLFEIIERDDGLIDVSGPVAFYFAPYAEWPEADQRAVALAHGRVLDVGSGAGRHALYLQNRGHEVVCLDNSPLALAVCRERGVRQTTERSITQTDASLGPFDTVLMMGNNFGLFGSFGRAQWLLRRWRRMVAPGGRVVALTLDPYDTTEPAHLAYHARNRARGRLGGQVRLRVRYRTIKGLWFDYLFVSRPELAAIVDGTGWHIERIIDTDGPTYLVILEQD